jgi:hypothetical protein
MSARPTAHACRAGLAAAVAISLLAPAGAVAKKGDKDRKDGGSPAVCSHDIPPGLAKKDGDLPRGVAKKVEGQAPCDEPGGPRQGGGQNPPAQGDAAASQQAPAAGAPVTTTAASTSPLPPCAGTRAFRLRLDRKGRVRTARVMLNGRAIPVTRGKRGKASVLIDLRGRIAGTYTVRTTVVTRKGGKLRTGTHRYRVC